MLLGSFFLRHYAGKFHVHRSDGHIAAFNFVSPTTCANMRIYSVGIVPPKLVRNVSSEHIHRGSCLCSRRTEAARNSVRRIQFERK